MDPVTPFQTCEAPPLHTEVPQAPAANTDLNCFERCALNTLRTIDDLFKQSCNALTQALQVFGAPTPANTRPITPTPTQDGSPSAPTSVAATTPEDPLIPANAAPTPNTSSLDYSRAEEIGQVAIQTIQGPATDSVVVVEEIQEPIFPQHPIDTAKGLMRILQKAGFSGETEELVLRVVARKESETRYVIEDRADPQIHVAIDGETLFINGSATFQNGLLASTIHLLQACHDFHILPTGVDFHNSASTQSKKAIAALLTPLMLEKPRLMCVASHRLPVDQFKAINSSLIQAIPLAQGVDLSDVPAPRAVFLAKDNELEPSTPTPVIVHSEIVSRDMVEHLMRHKQNNRCGKKFCPGDAITNAEGLLHQLVTPFVKAQIAGDILWQKEFRRFDADTGREVVINGSIHPDYEFNGHRRVMWALTCVSNKQREGRPLPAGFSILSTADKQNGDKRAAYDEQILQHLTYHLLAEHTLPATAEIPTQNLCTLIEAKDMLERLLTEDHTNIPRALQNTFVAVKTGIHSLEMLLNFYVLQLRNELGGLEALLPQGYVYTIDPPSIFAKTFDTILLNRLQCLAFKWLLRNSTPHGLRVISCNEAGVDKNLVRLWKQACGSLDIQVVPKVAIVPAIEAWTEEVDPSTPKRLRGLFTKRDEEAPPEYAVRMPYALALRSNGDGFGQHGEHEGKHGNYQSLEAVTGGLSTLACSLRRERKDLCDYVVSDA